MTHADDAVIQPLLLFIEDDRDALVAGAHLLTRSGLRVPIPRGGDDGVEKASRLNPAVIVTDLVMPRTSGFEVCARETSRIATGDGEVLDDFALEMQASSADVT